LQEGWRVREVGRLREQAVRLRERAGGLPGQAVRLRDEGVC